MRTLEVTMVNVGTTNLETGIWEGDDMIKKGDSHWVIQTYEKYWIYDKPYGHDIVIATEQGKHIIECRWSKRKRDEHGRVSESSN